MSENIRDIMVQIKNEGGFFHHFSEDDIDKASMYFKILQFQAGSIAAKEGEPLDLMGVMVSGEAILEEKTEVKDNWIVQARMKRGSILAHPSLFGVKPPPVRVKLPKDSVFLAINGTTFQSLLKNHPEIGIKFQQELIRVLFIRLRSYAARFTDVP